MTNVIPFPVRNALILRPASKQTVPTAPRVALKRMKGYSHTLTLKALPSPPVRKALAPPVEYIIYL